MTASTRLKFCQTVIATVPVQDQEYPTVLAASLVLKHVRFKELTCDAHCDVMRHHHEPPYYMGQYLDGDPNYRSNMSFIACNATMVSENGETNTPPTYKIVADDHVTSAAYALESNLMELQGWIPLKHIFANTALGTYAYLKAYILVARYRR